MNEDFEQRLRVRFAASDEPAVSEPFGGAVRERISALRRARRALVVVVSVAAGVAVVMLGAPLVATGTALIAAAPDTLNGALSALLVSPAGYLLGALTAAAAYAAAFSD
jgi:hypothetical protein